MKYIKLLILTAIFVLLTACDNTYNDSNPSNSSGDSSGSSNPSDPIGEISLRIACVGDSITLGTGLSNPAANSYPPQLANIINDDSEVGNFGVKSTTLMKNASSPYWNTSEFIASHSFNPDIVVIMLGTNDTKTNNWTLNDQFVSDYTDLISSYKNLDSRPIVYICYPPPAYGEVAGITDKRIKEELIPKIRQVANNNSVTVIDVYNALSGKASLFPDKIHPNAEGARLIAETVYPVIY